MTRINTISPAELHSVHLVAEYRELPRIFDVVLKAEQKGFTPASYGIPKQFVLGTGHVKFFADKLTWCFNRFHQLVAEMKRRNIACHFDTLDGKPMPKNPLWWNDWTVTEDAQRLIRERIQERINANPKKYRRIHEQ